MTNLERIQSDISNLLSILDRAEAQLKKELSPSDYRRVKRTCLDPANIALEVGVTESGVSTFVCALSKLTKIEVLVELFAEENKGRG